MSPAPVSPVKPERLRCEWPTDKRCARKVVAKIGLPGAAAIWVCRPHFEEWERSWRASSAS